MKYDDELEKIFFSNKEEKNVKKRLKKQDRSQFKKTDQKKVNIDLDKSKNKTSCLGQVFSIYSQGICVRYLDRNYVCTLRGVLKNQNKKLKNLVTVGDWVYFSILGDSEGVVDEIQRRTTELCRADNLNQKKKQLIAANIDQVLIVTSIFSPKLRPTIIDRYIIASLIDHIQPIIIINKIDLLSEASLEEQQLYQDVVEAYSKVPHLILSVSTKTQEGIELLKNNMKNRASVFAGQSGVGKSSLINMVCGTDFKTQGVVCSTNKGSHTTSMAQLVGLNFGGVCIDTPGIKSFGMWQLNPKEVQFYYLEFEPYRNQCQFSGCMHINEPHCQIKKAVEEKKISKMRYQSYLSVIEELLIEHKRR